MDSLLIDLKLLNEPWEEEAERRASVFAAPPSVGCPLSPSAAVSLPGVERFVVILWARVFPSRDPLTGVSLPPICKYGLDKCGAYYCWKLGRSRLFSSVKLPSCLAFSAVLLWALVL
ncbi:hypothetical protein SKAU_G00148430 [Synaphobranchus kaupii]|uniref:Uncharacterized protein n=1 Tax=Synaphobranchus kaupii TaxID=118154 RepID=A0A9Q1FUN0_SYNKA|nr:hypothetical protein SKAU_G00148430 [Synaphobranchus kaupii]